MKDIRENIFDLMKSFGFTMKMYDEGGSGPLISPLKAEYFYCTKGNQTYMLVIEDDDTRQYNTITMYRSDTENKEEFRQILSRLKETSVKNAYSINVQNFGRNFTPKDFSMKPREKKEREEQNSLEESFDIKGSKKTSYHVKENAKVVVKHKKYVDEKMHNARSRNIQEVFVTTSSGERRKVSEHSLSVGKAVANYVNSGGKLFDSTTNNLIELGNDVKKLKKIQLDETQFPVTEDNKNKIYNITTEARKNINKFISSISKKKTKIDEDCLDFLQGPQFDFTKAYYEALTGDEELAPSLARASLFMEHFS